jgi:hypothetical protein
MIFNHKAFWQLGNSNKNDFFHFLGRVAIEQYGGYRY